MRHRPASPISEWLRRSVSELSTIDAEAPLDDLEPLRHIVGNARVVGLGEGAHFIEEFWTVRRRLVRFLHERLGFDVLAAEFDLGEGDELAAWLADPSDPRPLGNVSRGAADWGMAATAHWLRSWGAIRAGRLRFAGIDAPNGGAAFAAMLGSVSRFLREVDPDSGHVLAKIESIAGRLSGASAAGTAAAWTKLGEAEQNSLTAGLARLRQRMHALESLFVSRADRARLDAAHRRLDALLCADYMFRATAAMHHGAEALLDHSVRDRFMADSVLRLLEREPGVRIALLAHNAHVQKRPVVWGDYLSAYPMGMYLHQALGDDYRVIGTTTTDDHTSEMKLDFGAEVGFVVVDAPIEPPQQGSLEAELVAAGFGGRPTLASLRKAADAGVAFDRIRAQSGYLTADIAAAYDGLLTLPKITLDTKLGF